MPAGQHPDFYAVENLIPMVEAGKFDVPEMQREFSRKPEWVAALVDSLIRSPEIPIGSLLVWEPTPEDMPRGGRYRSDSDASFLLLDGQGRLTGLLAALGMCPPWIPEEKWARLGGPALGVAVCIDADGTPAFRPLTPSAQGQIPLKALYEYSHIEKIFEETGMTISADLMGAVARLQASLRHARIRIDWMPGTFDDAVVAFGRRQAAGATSKLQSDEIYLCMLSAICGALSRDLVDPLLDEAQRRGFGKSVSRKGVKDMVEHLLPSRKRTGREPRPDEVRRAGERVTLAFRRTMNYLAAYGITRDEMLSTPAVVPTLAYLFDGFPQAAEDDFAQRWTAHVIARNIQVGRHRSLVRKITKAGTYENAQAVLASLAPGAMNPFPPERLHLASKARHFDAGGTLYAMASVAAADGAVRDLKHQDAIVWPDRRMRLRPLCLNPEPWLLTHHAFMTEDAAEIIRVHGGWTLDAYEELGCSNALLRAHHLPLPDPTVSPERLASWLHSTRSPLIATMIDEYQKDVGALADSIDEGPQTLPLGDLA